MKIVCYAEPTENGLLLHYPSSSVKAELLHLWEGAKENYNGYLAVDLKNLINPELQEKEARTIYFIYLLRKSARKREMTLKI